MSGSASERLKKLRQSKEEERESIDSSSNTSSSGERLRGLMGSRVEERERTYAGNKFGLDTLGDDLTDLGTTIGGIYDGWQSQETMANTKATVQAMYDRLGKYNDFQKKFGGTDLTETYNAYQTVLDEWDELSKTYGKYDNADEYQKALDEVKAAQEQHEEMRVADLPSLEKELKDLEKIGEYETKLKGLENRKNTVTRRSGGISTGDNIDEQIKQTEIEFREYLKSIGYTNTENLQKDIDEKTLYYNNAKRIQNLDTLENIKNDERFQEYADKGFSLAEEETGSLLNKSRKNLIAYYRTTPEVMDVVDDTNNKFNDKFTDAIKNTIEYKAAKYMTDDQFAIYNAYMGSGDEEKAKEYLDAIEEQLNYAYGTDIAESKDTLLEKLKFAADAGLENFGTNVVNLFNNDEYIPQTATQFASGMVRDSLDDTGFDIFGSSIGQIAYDTINTTSNMAPSILTSIALNAVAPGAGSIAGSLMMGSSAAGGAYQEMLNLGYNKGQARTYSALVGGSETLMQYLLGGIGALGGKLTNNVVQSAIKGIDNAFFKFALKYTLSGMSEGIEEGLQDIAAPFFENFVVGYEKNKAEDIDWEQVAYTSMLGFLTSWAIEGTSDAVSYSTDYLQNAGLGKEIRVSGKAGQMADMFETMELQGLTPEESEAYKLYGQYFQKGDIDTISNAKLGKLYSTVMNESKANLKSDKTTEAQKMDAASRMYTLSEMTRDKTVDEKAREERVEKLKKAETTKVNGKEAKLEGIKIEDGSTIVLTSQGEAKAEEVEFSSTDAELYAYAETMESGKANLFIKNYSEGRNVEKYAVSFEAAYEYGSDGIGVETALKNKGVLTESQVADIYTNAVKLKAETRQKAIDEITQKYAAKRIVKGTFDDSIIDYDGTSNDPNKVKWSELNTRQRDAVRLAKAFSKATGINITFTKSKVVNGRYVGAHGEYDPKHNRITLDVNAGKMSVEDAFDAIIPTLSHEVTHWMKAKSPALFAKMQENVMNTLSQNGMNVEEQIAVKMADMKRNHPEQEVTREDAVDELVAKACEDMLSNSETTRDLLNGLSKAEQKTFMQKVEEIFNNLLEWVSNLLSQYKSNSEEAKFLRMYEDKLKEAQKMWDAAFKDAVEVNQKLNAEGVTAEKAINQSLEKIGLHYDAETESVAPQMSERTWSESDYVVNREKAVENLAKALNISKKKAEKYVDSINSVARLIADDRARLDYDPNMDDSASVLKPNSDYKWSVDMSTLCAKRLLFTGTFDAIQKALPNTAMDSEDIVKLRQMMMDKGYQVACGICYVESTRREIGTITQDFIERYKMSQKTGNPITRVNSGGKVVELKKTKDQQKTTADKSTDRFYADKNYTPTLAELNTTDIDLVKRDHPLVYEAYLNYMNARGQSKPKLLETRAEYKGEIAKMFARKKNGDLNSSTEAMNASGGLRLQSFSDFEVAHLIDMMQVVMDMSSCGLMSQAYTKVPEFAEVFGNTGVKINLSLIAKGSGLDADGNLIFDDVEGIDHKKAFELRNKFSKNVGTILVGKNDDHIRKAMPDPRIDYIIPFHKSSWREDLYDALGLTGYADYTKTQHEKARDGRTISDFKPSEYWDYSKTGNENAAEYLRRCEEDNRDPKFQQFAYNEDGSVRDGYWKLLTDFKMYDNDGVGSPQTAVIPDFDMEAANRIMREYEGGHRSFPVAKDIVDSFVKDYKEKHPKTQYSDRSDELAINKIRDIIKEKPYIKEENPYVEEAFEDLIRNGRKIHERISGGNVLDRRRMSLSSQHSDREQQRTVALGIAEAIATDGRTSLMYRKLSSDESKRIEELATYSMVLRDPRFETFRQIYVKNGRIVATVATTSMAVDYSMTTTRNNIADELKDIQRRIKSLGADSFYVMHNHPSGNPNPSAADRRHTDWLKQNFSEFKGHLVVDHNKYTFMADSTSVTNGTTDQRKSRSVDFNRRIVDHPLLYSHVNSPQEVANASIDLVHDNDYSTVVYATTKGEVRAIQEVCNPFMHSKEFLGYVANRKRDFGCSRAFLVTENMDVYNSSEVKDGITRNILTDVYNTIQFASARQTAHISPDQQYDAHGKVYNTGRRTREEAVNYSDRDEIDTRTLLANALESVAQTDAEKEKLASYKEKIKRLNDYQFKLDSIRMQIKEMGFRWNDPKTIALKEEAEKLEKKIDYYDRQLLRLEATEHLRQVVNRARKVARKDAVDKYKDKMDRDAKIKSITQKSLMLNRWLKTNSKTEHVPSILQPAVVQLLNAIDFSSNWKLGVSGPAEVRGLPSGSDISIAKALSNVYKMASELDKMKADAQKDEALLNELDIPAFVVEELEQLSEVANAIAEKYGDKEYVLNAMTLEELQTFDKVITELKTIVKTANEAFTFGEKMRISDLGNEMINDCDLLGKKKMNNLATEYLEYDNSTPYYVFKRMGSVGMKMFNAFMDGQEKYAFITDKIEKDAGDIFKPEEAKEWSQELIEVEVLDTRTSTKDNPQYKTLQMTVAHAMSIYALSKREAAQGHLVGGGIRIKDFSLKGKLNKVTDSYGSTLSKTELESIISKLSDRQIEVAEKLQEYMSKESAKLGNEITMRRWGIEQFTEDFYFPMETIKNGQNFDRLGEKNNSIYRLLNASFTKALTPNAENKLVIDNIFDVFIAHTTDMAKYNAFALPMLDAIKVLGYTDKAHSNLKDGDVHDERSVSSAIVNAFGEGGLKYIVNLMKDLNGVETTPRGEAIPKRMMSNYKVAAVGANARVVLLQGTAFVKAAYTIDGKYLAKALVANGRKMSEKAKEHSGIALWKSKGNYDLNISRSVASRIKQDQTVVDKIKEKSLHFAGLADEITWGKLWKACEYWAMDNTDYKYDTDEFYEAVSKKFRDIIVSTQVVDSTMTRSQLMRSKSAMVQTMTAFMSESAMTYSMLSDVFFEWSLDARKDGSYKKSLKKNGKRFAKAVTIWSLTNVLVAAAGGLMDAARDDDDEEELLETYLGALKENLKDGFNPMGILPILRDIKSIREGFSPTRYDMQSFTTLNSAYKKWLKVIEGEGNVYQAAYKTLQGMSQLSGMPFSNAVRDVVAMWNTVFELVYPSLVIKTK